MRGAASDGDNHRQLSLIFPQQGSTQDAPAIPALCPSSTTTHRDISGCDGDANSTPVILVSDRKCP